MSPEDFLGLLESNEKLVFQEGPGSSGKYDDNVVYSLFPFRFLVYAENPEEVVTALCTFAERTGCLLVRADAFLGLCLERNSVDLSELARFSRHLICDVMRMRR